MITKRIDAVVGCAVLSILSSPTAAFLPTTSLHSFCRFVQAAPVVNECPHYRRANNRRRRPRWVSLSSSDVEQDVEDENDNELLESVDESTLRSFCKTYSLSSTGTKVEMLIRLRMYASERAEADRRRQLGRRGRVESNLEGKARHAIEEGDTFGDDDADDDELQGYFYYAATETEATRRMEEEERRRSSATALKKKSPSSITSPITNPDTIVPNSKGERVVTIYDTTEKNDLTSMTMQPSVADFSLEGASNALRSRQRRPGGDAVNDFTIDGTANLRRGSADDPGRFQGAKTEVYELVTNLLATTGAPAFLDDDEDDDVEGSVDVNSFASPYGFVGFNPDRIPPDVLLSSSSALRADDGRVLKEVLSDFELRAIGHDGFNADDKSKGGGHYRVVEEIGTFLEGYRKAEVRRIARETSSMMLESLVKEGVRGLDKLLAGMVREGDTDLKDGIQASSEGGELNGALVRYLEEAIRSQEQRVKRDPMPKSDAIVDGVTNVRDESDVMWNVTRGEDGTMIETIDPNTPAVKQLLREELEKTRDSAGVAEETLLTMTVQEKILLLLKLLRDRVKVEAVIGNDSHARNLRVLAYALRAANDDERHALIMEELGFSLDVS